MSGVAVVIAASQPKSRLVARILPRSNSADCRGNEIQPPAGRSEEHTSELQSLMRISYAVFCLKKKTTKKSYNRINTTIYITTTHTHNRNPILHQIYTPKRKHNKLHHMTI